MTVQPAKLLLGLLTLAAVGVSACSGPEPEYGFDGLCRGSGSPIAGEFHSPYSNWTVQWTPDGSQILFDYFGVIPEIIRWLEVPAIYAVHVSGRPVEKVLDLPSRDDGHGAGLDTTVFDLSADGSRIAYAACALSEESLLISGTDKRVYSYEIFVSNFDGANVKRLQTTPTLMCFLRGRRTGRALRSYRTLTAASFGASQSVPDAGPSNIQRPPG